MSVSQTFLSDKVIEFTVSLTKVLISIIVILQVNSMIQIIVSLYKGYDIFGEGYEWPVSTFSHQDHHLIKHLVYDKIVDDHQRKKYLDVYTDSPNMYHKRQMETREKNVYVGIWAEQVKHKWFQKCSSDSFRSAVH